MRDKPSSVADMRRGLRDGEVKTFTREIEPTGSEPAFYYVGQSGEYSESPIWVGGPPLEAKPTVEAYGRPRRSLAGYANLEFRFRGTQEQIADINRVGVGLYFISQRVHRLLRSRGENSYESTDCLVRFTDGSESHEWLLILPSRVIEAIDLNKTTVIAQRLEITPGSGLFTTQSYFPSGVVFRDDLYPEIQTFVDQYEPYWFWRKDLVVAAVDAGVRGLLAALSVKNGLHQSDIRS